MILRECYYKSVSRAKRALRVFEFSPGDVLFTPYTPVPSVLLAFYTLNVSSLPLSSVDIYFDVQLFR